MIGAEKNPPVKLPNEPTITPQVVAEHGLAPDRNIQRLQRAVQPLWKSMTGGCHLTRAADRLLEDAGFRVEQLHKGYAPGPKFAAFMYRGFAVRP